jgi:hypothetical protein
MADNASTKKLLAVTQLLLGRADDTTAKKEISQTAFINMAKNLGVNVTPDTLADLLSQEPMSGIVEPLDPMSDKIRFKGNEEPSQNMSVDQARNVVDSNAKKAMKRRK